jgi:predicted permease
MSFRTTIRSLARDRRSTLGIVLVLAIGGATPAAMFPLMDRLFVRAPSGVAQPSALRRVYLVDPASPPGSSVPRPSGPMVAELQHAISGVAEVAVRKPARGTFATGTVEVTANYFQVLGVRLARGRFFSPSELTTAAPVAVVSFAYWQAALGGDTAVLGTSVVEGGIRRRIVGVAGRDFRGIDLQTTRVWIPLPPDAGGDIIVRLHRTTSVPQLEGMATAAWFRSPVARAHETQTYLVRTQRINSDWAPGDLPQQVVLALQVSAVSLIVLLIAVVDAATLFLLRGMRRGRELAVRLALGESNGRLLRDLAMEGAVVGVVAAAASLVLAVWGGAMGRAYLWTADSVGRSPVDSRLLIFAVIIVMLGAVMASLLAGLGSLRRISIHSLQARPQGQPRYHVRYRSAMLILQSALACVLLIGAGVFVHSLRAIHAVPLGIDVNNLVTASAYFPGPRRASAATARQFWPAFHSEVVSLRSRPGVQDAALSFMAPMSGEFGGAFLSPNGDTIRVNHVREVDGNAVGPHYFSTAGMRLIEGRDIQPTDGADSPPVMLINESLAHAVWPGGSALGHCLIPDEPRKTCIRIVGVVSDAHLIGIRPQPGRAHYFLPLTQYAIAPEVAITVRAPPEFHRAIIQAITRDLAPELPRTALFRAQSLTEALAPFYQRWTVGARVLSVFGLLALTLTVFGCYSVIGCATAARAQEMGVRLALGAQRSSLLRTVTVDGVRPVAIGIAVGIAIWAMLGQVVAPSLFETSPYNPMVLGVAAATLLCGALAAAFGPALRASRVDPAVSLRSE